MMRRNSQDQSGFTAIELIIVVSIMALLMGMSAPVIVSVLRKQNIQLASSNILAVHDQAQVRAMSRYAPASNQHIGLVLVQDPGERAWVALVASDPGNGPYRSNVLLNSRNEPLSKYILPIDVDIWLNNGKLSATATREIAWFYQYHTGLPISLSAAGPSREAVNIGTTSATAGTVAAPLFGLTIATVPFVLITPTIAGQTGSDPGLSLRNPNLRLAMAIYSSGVSNVSEF